MPTLLYIALDWFILFYLCQTQVHHICSCAQEIASTRLFYLILYVLTSKKVPLADDGTSSKYDRIDIILFKRKTNQRTNLFFQSYFIYFEGIPHTLLPTKPLLESNA